MNRAERRALAALGCRTKDEAGSVLESLVPESQELLARLWPQVDLVARVLFERGTSQWRGGRRRDRGGSGKRWPLKLREKNGQRSRAMEAALRRFVTSNGLEPVEPKDTSLRPRSGRRRFPKLCYQRAHAYVLDHASELGIVVVHGLVHGHVAHAWVELPREGLVFDGARGRFYERASYLSRLGARRIVVLPPRDAAEALLRWGIYGPWFEEPREIEKEMARNPALPS